MIIDSAAIKMQAEHSRMQAHSHSSTLRTLPKRPAPEVPSRPQEDTLKLSDEAKKVAGTPKTPLDLQRSLNSTDTLAMQIIRRMIKEITGQELEFFSPRALQERADEISYQAPGQAPAQQSGGGMGLIYEQNNTYFESETTSFNAEGSISTRDGQQLSFSVSLSMSRTFYEESSLEIRLGDAAKIDPLVINFEGNAAELTSTSFQFDIDADGSPDQIAGLKSNSGMLALDKNRDGKINDGSELFGPKSGNGFLELAAYDEDKNQFIDEADSIYEKLRIWQRHEDGSQQLMGLGAKNIGAIYLGHVSTPFQLKNSENASLGEVASSGIYFNEQGGTGSIQQINFTA